VTLIHVTDDACWSCSEPGRAIGPDYLRACERHRASLKTLSGAVHAAVRLGATPEHVRIAAWIVAKDARNSIERGQP